jgi:hypothetical protein
MHTTPVSGPPALLVPSETSLSLGISKRLRRAFEHTSRRSSGWPTGRRTPSPWMGTSARWMQSAPTWGTRCGAALSAMPKRGPSPNTSAALASIPAGGSVPMRRASPATTLSDTTRERFGPTTRHSRWPASVAPASTRLRSAWPGNSSRPPRRSQRHGCQSFSAASAATRQACPFPTPWRAPPGVRSRGTAHDPASPPRHPALGCREAAGAGPPRAPRQARAPACVRPACRWRSGQPSLQSPPRLDQGRGRWPCRRPGGRDPRLIRAVGTPPQREAADPWTRPRRGRTSWRFRLDTRGTQEIMRVTNAS